MTVTSRSKMHLALHVVQEVERLRRSGGISERTADLVRSLNRPGAYQAVTWESATPVAARYRTTHHLTKVSEATVRTGIDYSHLAVNEGTTTGPLPWGIWLVFPYVIVHKGREYVRLYCEDGIRTRYFVNGSEVKRDDFNQYLTKSAREAKRPNGGTITVKAENVSLR